MKKVMLSLGSILVSFIMFVLGLMGMFPLIIGALLLFISIFFSVFFFNERHRFKGVHIK